MAEMHSPNIAVKKVNVKGQNVKLWGHWCKDYEKADESIQKFTKPCQVIFWVAGKLKILFCWAHKTWAGQ